MNKITLEEIQKIYQVKEGNEIKNYLFFDCGRKGRFNLRFRNYKKEKIQELYKVLKENKYKEIYIGKDEDFISVKI